MLSALWQGGKALLSGIWNTAKPVLNRLANSAFRYAFPVAHSNISSVMNDASTSAAQTAARLLAKNQPGTSMISSMYDTYRKVPYGRYDELP